MKLYTKLDAAGVELPADSTRHVVLIDYRLGLMIDVRDDRKATHHQAPELAAATDLLGFSDWHLPNDVQAFQMADRTRYRPTADPKLYPNTKASTWIWTSTVVPEDSDCAFAVDFDYGLASWNGRDYRGVVRAVRSIGAQCPTASTIVVS